MQALDMRRSVGRGGGGGGGRRFALSSSSTTSSWRHAPSLRSTAAAAAPSRRTVLVDLESVVAGLEGVITAAAWRAASDEWPGGRIAGTPATFAKVVAQCLPCTDEPEDAALLVRLLSDEGVVGARSASGREGPVVGRRPRNARGMLVSEVQEHWLSDVRAACLVRWSRESCSSGGGGGNSGGDSGGGGGGGGGRPDSSSAGGDTAETLRARLRSRYLAALLLQTDDGGLCTGDGGDGSSSSDGGPWAALRPRGRVADAINESTAVQAIHIFSQLPARVTAEALRRAGVDVDAGDGDGDGARVVVHVGLPLDEAARIAAEDAAAAGGELHCVVDRPARADALHAALLQKQPATAAAAAAVLTSGGGGNAAAGSDGLQPTRLQQQQSQQQSQPEPRNQQQQEQQQQRQRQQRVHVHVADWCGATASQRAAAGARLLGEHQLAELLGAGASRLVMDGVAWR